jgi:hypothetical protein
MSRKKSKRKKDHQSSAHKHSQRGDKLSDKPDHMHVDGKIETAIHPDPVKKHDAGPVKQNSRENIRFAVEVATLILLFVYTSLTFWQACTTNSVAKTSQRQLELDQRPWVGLIGSNHISIEMVKGTPIKMHLEFQNVGKTPALDEISVNNFANRPVSYPMPDFGGYSKNDAGPPITLMPNAIAGAIITTDKPGKSGIPVILSDADIDGFKTGKVQLFAYGSIWYNDTFGKPHRTDYCLQFLPPSGATPGGVAACPTHNYAD